MSSSTNVAHIATNATSQPARVERVSAVLGPVEPDLADYLQQGIVSPVSTNLADAEVLTTVLNEAVRDHGNGGGLPRGAGTVCGTATTPDRTRRAHPRPRGTDPERGR